MRVVLVPGFTQTPASWRDVIDTLDPGSEPCALEIPVGFGWAATVARLAGAGGLGAWVGYSMGGRLALQVALDRPDLVEHLVLVSATAGLRDAEEAATRRDADARLADHIESVGVEVFLAEWLARPMFARVPPGAAGIAERAEWSASDLATTLRNLGTGSMPNLWPRLGELELRVTIVTGRHDEKFTALGEELASASVNADVTLVTVDSGHAVPLECPEFLRARLIPPPPDETA